MINSPFRMARTTALLVAMGGIAYAAGDGTLTLSVTDAAGKPLPKSRVTITSPTQIGGTQVAVADATGKVRFPRLSPGLFRAVVTNPEYKTATVSGINVLVDQTRNVAVQLADLSAVVEVVAASVAQVDTTTVTAGIQVTQEEIRSLPIVRNQLAILNLAPGVFSVGGNPAMTAGLNRNNTGDNGARNNTYLIDGLDTTQSAGGTYSTTVPQELVANQDVKVGAITAEYSARAGLFSSVTLDSGSNEWKGGIHYSFAPATNFQATVGSFRPTLAFRDVTDTTIFGSGPIIKDHLWLVLAAQQVKQTADVKVDPTATLLPSETRKSTDDSKKYIAKLTWDITNGHKVALLYNKDPRTLDNLNAPLTPTIRATQTIADGERKQFSYTWQTEKGILDIKFGQHIDRNSTLALGSGAGPQVGLQTDPGLGAIPAIQRTWGNSSADTTREYQRDQARIDYTVFLDLLGTHTLKAGYEQRQDKQTISAGINGGASYENLGPAAPGNALTYGYIDSHYSGSTPGNGSRLEDAINAKYPTVRATLDTNHDGSVDTDEVSAYTFNELYNPADPAQGYFGYRITLDSRAKSSPKMKTTGYYIQDAWQLGRFTFSPGFRIDNYKFIADDGTLLLERKNQFSPRLGLTWDVKGDGLTKAYAYFGRYIDPIKLDMLGFTGSLISSVRSEQIRMAGTWVTHNVRGGRGTIDAMFADNFKLPKTDELRFGFAHDFGNAYAVDAVFTSRKDYDIVEDYDPALYTNATRIEAEARTVAGIPVPTALAPYTPAQRLWVDAYLGMQLPTSYFAGDGRTGAQNVQRVIDGELNFILANLPSGRRRFNTVDLTLTRKFRDNWAGFLTYSHVDATGNSLSSGDADFQGDIVRLDPRLPYNNGSLPGSIDWQFKGYIYYRWDNGLQVGLNSTYNSGYHYTPGRVISSRVFAVPNSTDYTSALKEERVGTARSPQVLDSNVRVQYQWNWSKLLRSEVYIDVTNPFNHQGPVNVAEAPNFPSGFLIGQATGFQAPRRMTFGFRLNY